MNEIVVDIARCTGCKSCELQCALGRDSLAQRFPDAIYEEVAPSPRVRVEPLGLGAALPIQCRQCDPAPCLDACPSGALLRDDNAGIVAYAETRCIGCWMCVMVCPFGAAAPRRSAKKMIKCDRCTGMEEPYCVAACPTGALLLADTAQLTVAVRRSFREVVVDALTDGRTVSLHLSPAE